jgi:hypothetical protein
MQLTMDSRNDGRYRPSNADKKSPRHWDCRRLWISLTPTLTPTRMNSEDQLRNFGLTTECTDDTEEIGLNRQEREERQEERVWGVE